MKKNIISSLAFIISTLTFAQIGIGTNTPASSSLLDLTSNSKGLLLPRVASTAAITDPANGLVIFDLSVNCIKVYRNGVWSDCLGATSTSSSISASCTGFIGNYCSPTLNSTTYVVTLTNNDLTAKQFTPQTSDLLLYGIPGLTVSAVSPNIATTINPGASLVITYTISGTRGSNGTLTGTFNKQGIRCSNSLAVPSQTITEKSANSAIVINYPISQITHTTTDATGIGTVTGLPPGLTATFTGNTISISGTPTVLGVYNYNIPVNGCGPVLNATGKITVTCGAYISPGVLKIFMCHNLGADTSLDPFTDAYVTGLTGNYYQWGRKDPAATPNTPQEPSAWNTTSANEGAWSDSSKTVNDPCPEGFRIPTREQFKGLVAYNTRIQIGTANLSFGPNFSTKSLTLHPGGVRDYRNGNRTVSNDIWYWSSSNHPNSVFTGSGAQENIYYTYGHTIRCISE